MKMLLATFLLASFAFAAQAQKAERLIGTWGNCKRTTKTGAVMLANACREITFQSDSTGQVSLGNPIQEAFTWQQRQNKLLIQSKGKQRTSGLVGVHTLTPLPDYAHGRTLELTDQYGTRYLLAAGR